MLPLPKDAVSILLSPEEGGSEIRIDLGSTVLTIERIGVENINVKLESKTTSESSDSININGIEYNESILEKELTDIDVLNLL